MKMIEDTQQNRTDCEAFEPKRYANDCGDCQTDGHYMCRYCKHIADFDSMELADNRMRYYPEQATKQKLQEEEEHNNNHLII